MQHKHYIVLIITFTKKLEQYSFSEKEVSKSLFITKVTWLTINWYLCSRLCSPISAPQQKHWNKNNNSFDKRLRVTFKYAKKVVKSYRRLPVNRDRSLSTRRTAREAECNQNYNNYNDILRGKKQSSERTLEKWPKNVLHRRKVTIVKEVFAKLIKKLLTVRRHFCFAATVTNAHAHLYISHSSKQIPDFSNFLKVSSIFLSFTHSLRKCQNNML